MSIIVNLLLIDDFVVQSLGPDLGRLRMPRPRAAFMPALLPHRQCIDVLDITNRDAGPIGRSLDRTVSDRRATPFRTKTVGVPDLDVFGGPMVVC
jgi:hypothetical protein